MMQILEQLLVCRLCFLDRINGLHCGICSSINLFEISEDERFLNFRMSS